MAEEKFTISQEQNFSWQSNGAARFIRSTWPRTLAGQILAVYRALTELSSESQAASGLWDRNSICEYSCLSKTIVIRCMLQLHEKGLITEEERRDDKGHRKTQKITINTHTSNPKSISGLRESGGGEAPQDVVVAPTKQPQSKNPKSISLPLGYGPQGLKDVPQNQEKTVLQNPVTTDPPLTPHQQIIEAHQVAFLAKYKLKPDYKPPDFKAVKEYLARGQTVMNFVLILPRFMAEPGKFTAGHSLRKACENWQAYLEPDHVNRATPGATRTHQASPARGGFTGQASLAGADPLAPAAKAGQRPAGVV